MKLILYLAINFMVLIWCNQPYANLEILPWQKVELTAGSVTVSSQLDSNGNFEHLKVKTEYGLFVLDEDTRRYLLSPSLKSLEVVVFPVESHDTVEYHVQFNFKNPHYAQRTHDCSNQHGILGLDYVRIKIKEDTPAEVKKFLAECKKNNMLFNSN